MSEKQNHDVAEKWLQAFNDHNLEKLLDLYHHNAEHFSPRLKLRKPETKGIIKGREEMKLWWKDAFDRYPSLEYRKQTITANNERVFMEYLRVVDGEENMNVAEVLEIRDGLIKSSRVYLG